MQRRTRKQNFPFCGGLRYNREKRTEKMQRKIREQRGSIFMQDVLFPFHTLTQKTQKIQHVLSCDARDAIDCQTERGQRKHMQQKLALSFDAPAFIRFAFLSFDFGANCGAILDLPLGQNSDD